MNRYKPTPQRVLDAMQVISEYLAQEGYSDVLLTPGGGASFSRGDTHLDRLHVYGTMITGLQTENARLAQEAAVWRAAALTMRDETEKVSDRARYILFAMERANKRLTNTVERLIPQLPVTPEEQP